MTQLRPRKGPQDVSNLVVVCELDQPLPFNGGLLHEVMLKARFRQTLVMTLVSRHQGSLPIASAARALRLQDCLWTGVAEKTQRCAPALVPTLK